MARELHGTVTARPIRVAFLVEDGTEAKLILDGIFADAYGRWGGRFSLIVPCKDGRVVESYWPWLKRYDADLIYSYVILDSDEVLRLHERLYPSRLEIHENRLKGREDVFAYKPVYGLKCLSSLSTLYWAKRFDPSSTKTKILDAWYGADDDDFVADNFGTYHRCTGSSMFPSDARATAQLLTIVPPEKAADRRFGTAGLEMIHSRSDAIQVVTERNATCLSLMSSWFAPRWQVGQHPWGEAFCVIVGNSFSDRVCFWNLRHYFPAWLDDRLLVFRVDSEQLADGEFLELLGDLLRKNTVSAGSGNQHLIRVVSASLEEAALADAAEAIRRAAEWIPVVHSRISVDQIAPTPEDLQSVREHAFDYRSAEYLPSRDYHWTGVVARPPPIEPRHLSEIPAGQSFTDGFWICEYRQELDGPRPRFANHSRWHLPRRWRMADAFETEATSSPDYVLSARASRSGDLTLVASRQRQIAKITLPHTTWALTFALARDGEQMGQRPLYPPRPSPRLAWMEDSNEALYLKGVVGLAGSLASACSYLLHPFWRRQFAKLGATPAIGEETLRAIVRELKFEAAKLKALDLNDPSDREALAHLIAKHARKSRLPDTFLRLDDLRVEWKRHIEAFWEARGGKPHDDDDDGAHYTFEEGTLDSSIQSLRARQLVYQGHHWTCESCNHRNWISIDAFSIVLTCEICRNSRPSPLQPDTLFKLNGFLLEGLRDHSVLSLLWVLSELRMRARHSFYYAPPSQIFLDYPLNPKGPDKEVDLLAVADGKTYLCEVKSSWGSVRKKTLEDLVALSERIRPDVAVLAVMQQGFRQSDAIKAAEQRLALMEIELQVMIPRPEQEYDEPYLPQGQEHDSIAPR